MTTLEAWLAIAAIALSLSAVRCGRDIDLGVDPAYDAAAPDAGDAALGE
jgi:hypothetical protein